MRYHPSYAPIQPISRATPISGKEIMVQITEDIARQFMYGSHGAPLRVGRVIIGTVQYALNDGALVQFKGGTAWVPIENMRPVVVN